jgi:hypothetical protein
MGEQLSKDDVKEALKEAHKEWLDDKFAAFGRWTFWALVAMLFGALIHFVVWLKNPGFPNAESVFKNRIESIK